MSNKSILIVTACVLSFLPLFWFILKISGADLYLLNGFWREFKWFALVVVVLIGGAVFINHKLIQKRK